MTNVLEYFATQDLITNPGKHATLLNRLPTDISQLRRVVQGMMIHIHWAEQYGVQLSEQRRDEVQLRFIVRQLDRLCELDPNPLANTRPFDKRLVGNCRDFSVMLTAILRHQGLPARARCGFGRYFLPNHYEDHWACEYWDAAQNRWVLVDAQLDDLQCEKLSIQFDPLDVPRDQFIVGGKAWQLCRTGQVDPDTFGIFDMYGLWFVRGNLVRDVASLNKMELLPWDSWGIIEAKDEDLSPEDLTFLDDVAKLTDYDVPEFQRVRTLYEKDSRLNVPATIRSYARMRVQTINLGIP